MVSDGAKKSTGKVLNTVITVVYYVQACFTYSEDILEAEEETVDGALTVCNFWLRCHGNGLYAQPGVQLLLRDVFTVTTLLDS